ncbi:MAG TPA: tagaturonate reductase [Chitinophagaceae bacterium]|nr:tagaturonate reductase [Chitinophagaceae bacterium]
MNRLNRAFAIQHARGLDFFAGQLEYPERILQFGTGVLLRGLVDDLVDLGNRKGFYRGRVVVVKSTGPDIKRFASQDNLYSLIEKGSFPEGSSQKTRVLGPLSRVIAAPTGWKQVISCACDPGIDVLVSNTTEAGLVYQAENLRGAHPPATFPAKLTALLWNRFEQLGEGTGSGLVILPTELVVDNGALLKKMVLEHARENRLGAGFLDWLEKENRFCSTLVDRIVPGKSESGDLIRCGSIDYIDALHTSVESYLLWAIEGGSEVAGKVGFHRADRGMVIRPDINPLREQKLRILNGSNSFVAALGFLYGCRTTYDTMQDPVLRAYVERQIFHEILPTLEGICPEAEAFAREVLDRFANPGIRYPLLQITLQYCSKMDNRNGMTFMRYFRAFGALPPLCTLGVAGFLMFYVPAGKKDGVFFGIRGAESYPYRDDLSATLCGILEPADLDDGNTLSEMVRRIYSDPRLFRTDLGKLEGFCESVASWMVRMHQEGVPAAVGQALQV